MTDDLTIELRILSSGVDKINSANTAIKNLDSTVKTTGNKINNIGKVMESTGSRINVLGQRMTGMVTLPLLFFANSAIKTALSVETAWTRFDKVFSGTEEQMAHLQEAGTELSEKFGINVEDVAEVMGEFNKAGIESEDMLKSLTEQALETSILFDTDLMGAFDGVKAIMFGFGLSGKETTDALAAINVVADSTTTSEQGILDVMERSGAIFKQYGVGVTEAAALTSLLAQSNIKGSTAGMAFKTVLARIGDAVPDAVDGMAKFGINVSGNAFRTATFSDKLRLLNKKQKEVFSSGNKVKIADWNTAMKDLTGIRQADRFSILVSKIGDLNGVIENAEDPIKNLKIWNEQLATVMDSSPHKFEIMNQIYRNQANILGKELLPYKIKLMEFLTGLLEKFNALSPETKEWVVKLAALVAIAGPVLAFFGLATTGLGFLLSGVGSVTLGIAGLLLKLTPLTNSLGTTAAAAGTSASTGLAGAMGVNVLGAMVIVAAYITTKAIIAYGELQKSVEELSEAQRLLKGSNEKLFEKMKTIPDKEVRDKLLLIWSETERVRLENEALIDQYTGWSALPAGFMAWAEELAGENGWLGKIADKAYTAWEALKQLAKEGGASSKGNFSRSFDAFKQGDFPNQKRAAMGGVIYAAQGFAPKGNDTIPAMLSPGEMVLNKSQQGTLFNILSGKSQLAGAGGATVNINVAGNMIASRGEQREFVRQIEVLMTENANRS